MTNFIAGNEVNKLIDSGAQLVDVRNPQEFLMGSMPGAVNVPLPVLQTRIDELNSDQQIIVFCRTGARSAKAKMILENFGFTKVINGGGLENLLSSV